MQTLLQGDAFAVRKILEYLVDEQQTFLMLHFALTCKQFNALFQQYRGEPFERIYSFCDHRWNTDRVLKNVNYLNNIKWLDFYKAPESATRMLDVFDKQLEKLMIENVVDVPVNNVWQFDKLKELELRFFVTKNESDTIQQWVSKAPQLQILDLHFKNSMDQGKPASAIDVYETVKHIPKVGLVLEHFSIDAALAFSPTLTSLESPCIHATTWFSVIEKCTVLEKLHVNEICPSDIVLPKLNHLNWLVLENISFEELEQQEMFFQSLPRTLKTLRCYNTSLINFPSMQELVNLEYLYFSGLTQKEAEIPDSFSKMASLKEITLYFENDPAASFNSLPPNITVLRMEYCILERTCRCIHAKDIHLRCCEIESVEQLLTGAKHLSSFAIKQCTIDAIRFDLVPQLFHASIVSTAIANDLMSMVIHLQSVGSLYLDGCNLISVPLELGQLPLLQYLVLSNNQITTIDDNVCHPKAGQFACLEFLNLEDNPIQAYPASIGMPMLQEILLPILTTEDDYASPTIEPAGIDRTEWSTIVLNHMKYSRERYLCTEKKDGHKIIRQVIIAYAIPLLKNQVLLNCHFDSLDTELGYYDFKLEDAKRPFVSCLIACQNSKKIAHAAELGMPSLFDEEEVDEESEASTNESEDDG